MVHSKIMNHMVDENTANQIKEYIDARNPYNLLRLVAPSIQYIRQNLDVLPGMGWKIKGSYSKTLTVFIYSYLFINVENPL